MCSIYHKNNYCQISNISRTLVGNKFVDHSDVVVASPVSATPTTSSFQLNTWLQWIEQRQLQDETRNIFKFWDLLCLILEIWQYVNTIVAAKQLIEMCYLWNMNVLHTVWLTLQLCDPIMPHANFIISLYRYLIRYDLFWKWKSRKITDQKDIYVDFELWSMSK